MSTTAGTKRKDHCGICPCSNKKPKNTMGNSTKSNSTICIELGEAMDAVTSNFETAEVDGEVEEIIIEYKLRQPPASCKAKWWTHLWGLV